MTKIQRHVIRRAIQKEQEKTFIEAIKMIPAILMGYGFLWLVLAI
jgi:hypothetical protein